jgi:hypothetical protein
LVYGNSEPRYVLLVRDQQTYDVCIWDIDLYTYATLSRFHKTNKHFDIDFVMRQEGIHENKPHLERYVVTPVLSSSGVPEFFDEPKDWFDRYMDAISFADDYTDEKAGRVRWDTSHKRPPRDPMGYWNMARSLGGQ